MLYFIPRKHTRMHTHHISISISNADSFVQMREREITQRVILDVEMSHVYIHACTRGIMYNTLLSILFNV